MRISKSDRIILCPQPLHANPLAIVVVYLGGAVGLAFAFAAVANLVGAVLCPVVLAATLIAVGVIGAIQLAVAGKLNRPFVELMRIFYKGLPGILGKKIPEGKDVSASRTPRQRPAGTTTV
jgi:UDP-N-acetylglucosamine:LPS N-acetylglucosamine transferase